MADTEQKAPRTVACVVDRDYWTDANEVFIGGSPLPAEERVLSGMAVDIAEKRAFALANAGVVKLSIPHD